MALGLELILSKDLSYQYTRGKPGDERGATPKSNHDGFSEWHCFGPVDYVKVRPFDNVSELQSRRARSHEQVHYGNSTSLALFCNPQTAKTIRPEAVDWFASSNPSGFQGNFFHVAELSISSIILNASKTYSSILSLLARIEGRLSEYFKDTCTDVYWSLGSSDLYLLCRPDNATVFFEFLTRLKALRESMCTSNQICLPSVRPIKLESRSFQSLNCNCHILSQVNLLTCVRDKAAISTIAKTEEFISAESGFAYTLDVAVSPGHEIQVTNLVDLQKTTGERADFTYTPRSIRLQLKHFGDVFDFIRSIYWESEAIRRTYVEGSRTTILSRVPESDKTHDPIPRDGEVCRLIEDVRNRINEFSTTFVGETRRAELEKELSVLESALFRNERIGAVRDLIPFLRQLSYCFNGVQMWKDYYEDRGELAGIALNTDTLITNLSRAIKNRIERKPEPSESTFPVTLDQGLSRLVNAYTIVAWLCSELLCRKPGSVMDSHCFATKFGALVCAGTSGRVECTDLFYDFREFTEARIEEPILAREHEKEEEWSAPLLLVSISGPTLLEPEIALVLCLHEMAEFSSWTELPHTKDIRVELNYWIKEVLVSNIVEIVRRKDSAVISNVADGRVIVNALLIWSLEFSRNKDARAKGVGEAPFTSDINKIDHFFTSQAEVLKPLKLVDGWARILNEFVRANVALPRFSNPNQNEILHALLKTIKDFEVFSELDHLQDDLKKIATEVFADIGMWVGLDHILHFTTIPKDRGSMDRIKDLDRIYRAIFKTLYSWAPSIPPDMNQIELVIARWGLQACAMCDDENSLDSIVAEKINASLDLLPKGAVLNSSEDHGRRVKVLTESLSRMDDRYRLWTDKHPQDEDIVRDSLRRRLQRLRAYKSDPRGGDDIPLWTPSKASQEGKLLNSFAALWVLGEQHPGIDKTRLRFMLELWAKSQIFSLKSIVETSVVAVDGK